MRPWIKVSVKFFPSDEGGRKGSVYLNGGYRPHFRVIGDTEFLGVQFIEATDKIIVPNEKVDAKVCFLYYPDVSYNSLNEGKEFEILEGARVVGKGQVISQVSSEE
jgi:translation elongation factor EF-Tu-like GTPase